MAGSTRRVMRSRASGADDQQHANLSLLQRSHPYDAACIDANPLRLLNQRFGQRKWNDLDRCDAPAPTDQRMVRQRGNGQSVDRIDCQERCFFHHDHPIRLCKQIHPAVDSVGCRHTWTADNSGETPGGFVFVNITRLQHCHAHRRNSQRAQARHIISGQALSLRQRLVSGGIGDIVTQNMTDRLIDGERRKKHSATSIIHASSKRRACV